MPKSTDWARANPEKHSASVRKSYQKHREVRLAKAAAWRAANPGRVVERKRLSRFVKYGVTEAQYDTQLLRQDNRCAICVRPFEGVGHIDHDHATGMVRGLLCSTCNTALGKFRDDPKLLYAAVRYLENPPWTP